MVIHFLWFKIDPKQAVPRGPAQAGAIAQQPNVVVSKYFRQPLDMACYK